MTSVWHGRPLSDIAPTVVAFSYTGACAEGSGSSSFTCGLAPVSSSRPTCRIGDLREHDRHGAGGLFVDKGIARATRRKAATRHEGCCKDDLVIVDV